MEFVITSNQIMGLCALVASLWGLCIFVDAWNTANYDLKPTLEKHDALLDNDNRRLKQIEDSNRMILQCLLVLINHNITGNGIEKMKDIREELQDFLINK